VCYQCLAPLTLWVRTLHRGSVLEITLSDNVCQWLVTGRWFPPGTPDSSTNKTGRHDITKILFKVALNTITITITPLLNYFLIIIISSSSLLLLMFDEILKTFIEFKWYIFIVNKKGVLVLKVVEHYLFLVCKLWCTAGQLIHNTSSQWSQDIFENIYLMFQLMIYIHLLWSRNTVFSAKTNILNY
jgi:hypothetical protein